MSVNINHINQYLCNKLPRTDCRFWPDLRAYEYGDIDLASSEKTWLEND